MVDDPLFGVSLDRWGGSREVALSRLQISSFVSTKHRYLYMMTPKVGCTTIKHMISAIEGIPFRPEVLARRHRESKRGMLIHDQDALAVARLTTLPPDQAAALLAPESGYLVFAFVRNPYSRLFSAWNNKLRFVEPGYAPVAEDIQRLSGGAAPDGAVSFADFVRYVCRYEDKRNCDHHWALQSALLFPDAIAYSFICPIEEFDRGWMLWRSHLEQVQGGAVDVLATARNVSPPEDWRASFDQDLADLAYAYYAEDFDRFGYDRESWRTSAAEHERARSGAETEAFYRREIVERNRMIDLLYDKIDQYSDLICYYHDQIEEKSRRLDQAYSKIVEYSALLKKEREGKSGAGLGLLAQRTRS
jgi:hypothetical protein